MGPPVRRKGLSLRVKLLALLTALPVIVLALYLGLAIRLFQVDKVAYVYDSALAVARSMAAQVRSEVDSILTLIRPIAEGFDPARGELDANARALFDKIARIASIHLYSVGSGGWKQSTQVRKPAPGSERTLAFAEARGAELAARADAQELAIEAPMAFDRNEDEQEWIIFAIRLGKEAEVERRVLLATVRTRELVRAFTIQRQSSVNLLDVTGRSVLGPRGPVGSAGGAGEFSDWEFFRNAAKTGLPEAAGEFASPDGADSLISYSKVGAGGLMVVSRIPKEAALRAVATLIRKSALFFAALVSFSTLASVFGARRLTRKLAELNEATNQVANGKFDITVPVDSGDEVGSLAFRFNRMAAEVSRLMQATAAKARMEKELETARLVQETLFPPACRDFGKLQVAGFFEPASECGGDWWHYCEIGGVVYVWIGDATGHGASAALLTSAARSAASIIEKLMPMSPSLALTLMNRAIHDLAGGRMCMTFFLAAFDLANGKLTYANASHDPPYLARGRHGLTRSALQPLLEPNGKRLGEARDTRYEETSIELGEEEFLILYSDGVSALSDASGKAWGQRRFLQAALEAIGETGASEFVAEKVRSAAGAYRGSTPLEDDVTFVVCRHSRASEEAKAS